MQQITRVAWNCPLGQLYKTIGVIGHQKLRQGRARRYIRDDRLLRRVLSMIQRVDRRAVVPDLERHVHRAKRDSLEREAAL
jgi:hypothetical protein